MEIMNVKLVEFGWKAIKLDDITTEEEICLREDLKVSTDGTHKVIQSHDGLIKKTMRFQEDNHYLVWYDATPLFTRDLIIIILKEEKFKEYFKEQNKNEQNIS